MRAPIDVPFLRALYAAQGQPWWDHAFEAISAFSRANTDNQSVLPQSEATQMIGAFERLFGLAGGDEKALRKSLSTRFVPVPELPFTSCERFAARRYATCSSVREAWIADFFRLRGHLSHGHRGNKYPSAWSLNEHLLLGAFLFPLLLKLMLAEAQLYTLSSRDRASLNAFEKLAAAHPFEKLAERKGSHDWGWNRILGTEMLRLV